MIEIPRDTSNIPPEVMDTLHEARAEADKLRALGATEERIKSKVALGRKLAMLAARGGIDISAALPQEESDELTPEEEAEVDRLDAMGIMSIAEAIQRVKSKRR